MSLNDEVLRARAILAAGAADRSGDEQLFALAMDLKRQRHFAYARQLLARARQVEPGPPVARYRTEQALCTSKDPELPAELRFDAALDVLGDLSQETYHQAFAVAGSVHKARWQWDGQTRHLASALDLFERGAELEAADDAWQGYCAINEAFVLDILACVERDAGTGRRERAREIREALLERLRTKLLAAPGSDWWLSATLIEALLGLDRFEEAEAALPHMPDPADQHGVDVENTVQQVVALSRMRHGVDSEEFARTIDFLETWLGGHAPGIRYMRLGKLGLALSGGGFRASFFHCGVLAYLADRDLLRHVQALSCVSGGSIAGAQYYLRLRELLEAKPDEAISRDDYRAVVQRVIEDFRVGVGANVRGRLLSDVRGNFALLRTRGGSRTERLVELIDDKLIGRVPGARGAAMRQLRVAPHGDDDFHLRGDNWRRRAKVPVLMLNATTLNTGHVWQFTASSLGEPASPLSADVDMNAVLRRAWYADLDEPWRDFRLAKAVTSSACVPGLFAPLVVRNLYPGFTVKLVDGGVHDNQGITGLFDEECTAVIVSDASGQMKDAGAPDGSIVGVLGRSSAITMARVRSAQYDAVDARADAGVIRNRLYVHLLSGLERDVVLAGDEVRDPLVDGSAGGGSHTPYGIDDGVQRALAQLRTDLDAFSDVEAFGLMESGYRQMEAYAPAALSDFPMTGEDGEWEFRGIGPALEQPDAHLRRVLAIGAERFFKVPLLMGISGAWLKRGLVASVLALLVALLLGIVGFHWKDVPEIVAGVVVFALALPFLLAAGAVVQLRVLDPYFRRQGAVDRAR